MLKRYVKLPNIYKLKRRQTFECLKSNNIILFFCDENPCKRQRAHFSVFFLIPVGYSRLLFFFENPCKQQQTFISQYDQI